MNFSVVPIQHKPPPCPCKSGLCPRAAVQLCNASGIMNYIVLGLCAVLLTSTAANAQSECALSLNAGQETPNARISAFLRA